MPRKGSVVQRDLQYLYVPVIGEGGCKTTQRSRVSLLRGLMKGCAASAGLLLEVGEGRDSSKDLISGLRRSGIWAETRLLSS